MTAEFRYDLHVHSRHSPDSSLSVGEIAARLRSVGVRGFALTDHNSTAGLSELRDVAARFPDLLVVPGVEVSTADGHLLAYGVAEAPPARRPLAETIAWVRAHGGEPVLAHPFRRIHGVGARRAGNADVRALEACNGQSSPGANRAAERLARARGLGTTGGSDAHTEDAIGRAYTVTRDPPGSSDALLEILRRGQSSGAGASLGLGGRLRWSVRNAWLRAGRGLREV